MNHQNRNDPRGSELQQRLVLAANTALASSRFGLLHALYRLLRLRATP
jgi:hypothetical protein